MMQTLPVVIGEDEKTAFLVFDWENDIYYLLLEERGDRWISIFSGDIEILEDFLVNALKEIEIMKKNLD